MKKAFTKVKALSMNNSKFFKNSKIFELQMQMLQDQEVKVNQDCLSKDVMAI